MFYRISNTASRMVLEEALGRPLKFPHLYEKRLLINGFEEVTHPIVSMEESQWLTPAIWGLLPQGYREDWQAFQHVFNTLNTPLESLDTGLWYGKSLLNQRCLIPVTGFFASYLTGGSLYPYYVKNTSETPFCLAGIYTLTDDGYVTFSILTHPAAGVVKRVHNVDKTMPLILNEDLHAAWLEEFRGPGELFEILSTPHQYRMEVCPIARECFNSNISYESMLEPVFYNNLPVGVADDSSERINP